jgi:hypothetical protein
MRTIQENDMNEPQGASLIKQEETRLAEADEALKTHEDAAADHTATAAAGGEAAKPVQGQAELTDEEKAAAAKKAEDDAAAAAKKK